AVSSRLKMSMAGSVDLNGSTLKTPSIYAYRYRATLSGWRFHIIAIVLSLLAIKFIKNVNGFYPTAKLEQRPL
ncbi:hypothetical protein, partial [Vibrio anguillarum]|uniref:hypothetical protein n=1 Tax=Vibrio anguillarum TaxID=55601 RepID=UPI001BE3FAA4